MADIFLEATNDPAVDADAPGTCGDTIAICLGLHRATWQESYVALDGRRRLARFDAPDAEAVRLSLRHAGADVASVWPGTIEGPPVTADANVVVQQRFAEPVSVDRLRAIEDRAPSACGRLLRRILSRDRTRVVWIYRAPDTDTLRAAAATVQCPSRLIWACHRVAPDHLRGADAATRPGCPAP